MMILISVLIALTSQVAIGKVITINTTGGSDNTTCCVDGECVCTSLSTALHYMTSNTVINITSESVTLEDNIKIGSGDLNNITIIGNGGTTIMCNNSGGVYCESCDNVVIEGITWDRCGDPNGTDTAGVTFNGTTNIVLVNSTFQYSQTQAITLYDVSGTISLTRVGLKSNKNSRDNRGVVYIWNTLSNFVMLISDCEFVDNSSPGRGAALYVNENCNTGESYSSNIHIVNSDFIHNTATVSVVYVTSTCASSELQIQSTLFADNIGVSLHVVSYRLSLTDSVNFVNNSADNGAGLYIDQEAVVNIADEAVIQFTNNSAEKQGGAIFIDLTIGCPNHGVTFSPLPESARVSFINNKAEFGGNSLYFNVPKSCDVSTNISDFNSILYIPCQFNYSEIVNGTATNVSCELELNNTAGVPVATSPHHLRLYGDNIVFDNTSYFISNVILGCAVTFSGTVFDYFDKPAEPTQFRVECKGCTNNFTLSGNRFQVDDSSVVSMTFSGKMITNNVNITLQLLSILYYYQPIEVTLVVELVPCLGHPGFAYSSPSRGCVCYNHEVVQCYDNYNEIKQGYWFGSLDGVPTTSLCRQSLCNFVTRRETRGGYFELPDTIDGQCFEHRTGSACGECSLGHTLAYDSADCISVDHCSTGMTVLVVVLTCLYWIVVVVGVFSLMYFNFQISSGYVYGIIYYYSMVGILLDNNPYISDGVFQFFSVLSSFAQLSPQFLGQLCFVTGLSGIDQLFIHYSHAVAVSILTLVIVLAARCSVRVTVLVSRCVIRVICLLLLLSYMSLASTSLQLLRPLKFTDVNEVYTYASPHIGYFHGHHAIYGIVAVICELVVGIGLPLLLLLEPLLSRKINFIKIKPLLDQFQGCYKDKYRWFVAYYLICRQVIMLIVFVGNSNYYNMLFYLQTTLVVIAMIHMWAQPYQDESLNALDGLILLVMVLVVNINTFLFLQNVTTELSIFLVVLPIFLFCSIAVQKLVRSCVKKKRYPLYGQLDNICNDNNDKIAEENALRNIQLDNAEEADSQGYNTFQESLLEYSLNDN